MLSQSQFLGGVLIALMVYHSGRKCKERWGVNGKRQKGSLRFRSAIPGKLNMLHPASYFSLDIPGHTAADYFSSFSYDRIALPAMLT